MRKKKSILLKLLFISTVLLSTLTVDTIPVKAVGGYQRIKEIKYPSWLGNWSTWMGTIDGKLAYCLESSKDTPDAGTYAPYVIENNEALLKVLYYGYGGPGDVFNTPEEPTNEDNRYLYTHLMAAFAYSGDLYGGKDWQYLEEHGVGLLSRYNQIQSLPVPVREFTLTDGNLQAYYNTETGKQRTQNTTFQAEPAVSITIPLQNDVSLHNMSTNEVSYGNAVIHGNETFYLEADKFTVKKHVYENLTGDGLSRYAPLAIKQDDSHQVEAALSEVADTRKLSLKVNWLETGSLQLKKTNEENSLIDGSEFLLKHNTMDYEMILKVENGFIKAYNLPVGTYTLKEIKVPAGYVSDGKEFQITINADQMTESTIVNKLRPTGQLEIKKALISTDAPIDVAEHDPTLVHFQLKAKNDIYDSVTNTLLYHRNETIKVGSGQGSNNDKVELLKGRQLENGDYACDNNGFLYLAGLPMGTYTLKEVQTPSGYVPDEEVHEIVFKAEDHHTLTYRNIKEVMNKESRTEISKFDEKNTFLKGAKLQILNEDNEVLDEWISGQSVLNVTEQMLADIENNGIVNGKVDKQTYVMRKCENSSDYVVSFMNGATYRVDRNGYETIHVISGLKPGIKYTLHEVSAPDGYVNAADQTFVVKDLNQIGMKDDITKIDISKQDITTGKELPGATLQVLDEKGTIVEEWISTEEEHRISKLLVNHTYTLREIKPADGYVTAEEIQFTVKDTGEVQRIEMKDDITKVKISKQDLVKRKELSGARLQILDKKGNIVDEWISTKEPHMITKLKVNETYILKEIAAPDGYEVSESISFIIKDTEEIQTIIMYDKAIHANVRTSDTMPDKAAIILIMLIAGNMAIILKKKRSKKC